MESESSASRVSPRFQKEAQNIATMSEDGRIRYRQLVSGQDHDPMDGDNEREVHLPRSGGWDDDAFRDQQDPDTSLKREGEEGGETSFPL
jgi:hypothetical protein